MSKSSPDKTIKDFIKALDRMNKLGVEETFNL